MDTRVLFHHTGIDGKLSLSGLFEMMQDCGNLHGEDTGVSLEYQNSIKRTWVVASWQVIINDRPKLGESITLSTWGYKFRAFLGLRNFEITGNDGRVIGRADSQWVMMDSENMKPVNIPDGIARMYGIEPDKKLKDDFPKRNINLAENMEEKEPFKVPSYMIDLNGHMNNCNYIRIAEKYIPTEFDYNRFSVEYVHEALEGDLIIPMTARLDDGMQVILKRADGEMIFKALWQKV